MAVRRLNHAVLYVHGLERTVRFYTQTLGFEVRTEIPGRAEERGAARDLGADLEAQGLRVEAEGALETVHVQHSVVQAADGHRGFLPSGTC